MKSQREQCIDNLKGVANLELYEKIANFGNDKLGHIWDFTPDDILKVMEATLLYCIEMGELPKRKALKDICYRELNWIHADGAIKIITHTI